MFLLGNTRDFTQLGCQKVQNKSVNLTENGHQYVLSSFEVLMTVLAVFETLVANRELTFLT